MESIKELRQGNWIAHNSEYYKVIDTYGRMNAVCAKAGANWGAEEIDPIPLTPEILLKAENLIYHVEYRVGLGWEVFRQTGTGSMVYIATINYLHQLQNIQYALTSHELTINL